MATAPPKEAARFLGQREDCEIDKLFRALVKLSGSDLHLKADRPPFMRVNGTLRPMNRGPIDDEEMVRLCLPMIERAQSQNLRRNRRRRLRPYHRRSTASCGDSASTCCSSLATWAWSPDASTISFPISRDCTCRRPWWICASSTRAWCCWPASPARARAPRSPRCSTGSIATIASTFSRWKIPIEFVFTEDKCLINQREIGLDVKDFAIGMKHAVREDPDVMLVGEMRDEETFMTAIHAAETGHLVFGTIHASSAPSTIGRILDLFPQNMHAALRSAIAMNMKGIVAQKLLPSIKPGVGRVPTVEIMTFNPTVRKLLLEEHDEKLADAIVHVLQGGNAGLHDEPQGARR